MSRTHGVIINLSSYLPFVFTFNPEEMDSTKKINYVVAPNIGGSHKKRYFSGFDSQEVSFKLVTLDMQGPVGVTNIISYFEQLRRPDAGIFGIAGSFFGNENYPPPQILMQFGMAYVPLVFDVVNIDINTSHYTEDIVAGVVGFPKKAEFDLTLALDEDHPLNKANMIAEKASYLAGSIESVLAEGLHHGLGRRKESYLYKKD